MDSHELSQLSDDELKRILPDIVVISRALPQDKVRLVRIAQAQNLVVGMTGDGINDAPSLKLRMLALPWGQGQILPKKAQIL